MTGTALVGIVEAGNSVSTVYKILIYSRSLAIIDGC